MPTTTFRTCPYCIKELEEKELDAHSLSCGGEEVECGNGCGKKMPRWMHQQHKEVSCKVQCDGCSAMILFNEVENHKQLCSMETRECNSRYGFQDERFTSSSHMTEHSRRSLERCPHCTQAVEKTQMEEHVAKCEGEMCCCDECGKKVQKDYMDVHMKEYCCKRVKECVFCDTSVVVNTLPEHYEVCELFPVQCENRCGNKIARKNLNDHSENCPKKLIRCEYCEIDVEFEFLENHLPDCAKFLLPCSENCGKNISREFLQQHLHEECEKLYGLCEFKEILCTHEDFPAGMQRHMQENVNHHMRLMMDMFRENEKKVNDHHKHMEEEIQNIQAQVTSMQENFTEMSNLQAKQMNELVKEFETRLKLGMERTEILDHGRYLWKITDMQSKINAFNEKFSFVYSPPFYSRKYGYKLRIAFLVNIFLPANDQVCFRVDIMPGEFDSILKWPFCDDVTLKLIDQKSGGQDLIKSFRADHLRVLSKPKKGVFNRTNMKIQISLKTLTSRNYIVDDALFLEVCVNEEGKIYET